MKQNLWLDGILIGKKMQSYSVVFIYFVVVFLKFKKQTKNYKYIMEKQILRFILQIFTSFLNYE
jgi:hypothetical protein